MVSIVFVVLVFNGLLNYATYYSRGADTALPFCCFCASSNRRTRTSHFAVWQICRADPFTASENNVRPAARSTASTAHTCHIMSLQTLPSTRNATYRA